jgi:hypothetical protein
VSPPLVLHRCFAHDDITASASVRGKFGDGVDLSIDDFAELPEVVIIGDISAVEELSL